jgi:hypothetical protein
MDSAPDRVQAAAVGAAVMVRAMEAAVVKVGAMVVAVVAVVAAIKLQPLRRLLPLPPHRLLSHPPAAAAERRHRAANRTARLIQ